MNAVDESPHINRYSAKKILSLEDSHQQLGLHANALPYAKETNLIYDRAITAVNLNLRQNFCRL